MPNTKSAKKALHQSETRKAHNLSQKRKLKNLLKEIDKLMEEKKTKEAKELLPKVYKFLDKSSKTNLIKKNTASRKKSRLTKKLNQVANQ